MSISNEEFNKLQDILNGNYSTQERFNKIIRDETDDLDKKVRSISQKQSSSP